ncbi:MAG: hypothetical protein Q8O94_02945 [bacterium]|nr:hypothetical protein [bacterium]
MIPIVIPHGNNEARDALLNSIREKVRLIVVVDRSKVNLSPGLEGEYFITLDAPQPFNFAGAVNVGICEARKYWEWTDPTVRGFVLMNDDTEILSENFFATLESEAHFDEKIGIISPRIEGRCGQKVQLHPGNEIAGAKTLAFICVYIKKELLLRVGLLDERFTGYGYEDDDYCLRTVDAGYKLAVTPKCLLRHSDGKERMGVWEQRPDYAQLMRANKERFDGKWIR